METTAELTESDETSEAADGEDGHYELVNGQRVELPPMSVYANRVAAAIVRKLVVFTESNDVGEVVPETLFRLPLAEDRNRNRQPDVAFVSYQRWPKGRPTTETVKAWDVVPDLAVEVASPTDRLEDILGKVEEYLRAGVRLVWLVCPRVRVVYAYEPQAPIRRLTRADTLDGGAVLPGFQLPLATLFQEPPAAPAPTA